MGVQDSNDAEVLESCIIALQIYCGYAAASRVQEFLNEIILPVVRWKEVRPAKACRQSARHVVAAMRAAARIISAHTPLANQPKQLDQFITKLLLQTRQPVVLHAIVAAPDIVQSLSVQNCSTVLKCLHDPASGEATVGRGEVIEALAAHIRNEISRSESGLCSQFVACLVGLSRLGYRSDDLAADVQKAFGQSLHAKNHTDVKMQRV